MTHITEKAYAKINLYLDVTAKRPDGFHEINTVMHTVSLFDTVCITAEPADSSVIELSVIGAEDIPTDRRNLVYRAAEEFLFAAGVLAHLKIELTKNIPTEAGLAGGSSDAAATLRALNRLFGGPLTADELHSIAASIGSDVAYCLVGGTVLCSGRGEILSPVFSSVKLHLVIAKGSAGVSTPAAYAALDRICSDFDGTVPTLDSSLCDGLISALESGDCCADYLANVFESAIIPSCPDVAELKKLLLSLGAKAALMSGSGSSVFGIFRSGSEAESAAEAIRSRGYYAEPVESVGYSGL